jgi:hypothetical protein
VATLRNILWLAARSTYTSLLITVFTSHIMAQIEKLFFVQEI